MDTISIDEAIAIHNNVMSKYPDESYGLRDIALLESALSRPMFAETYAGADLSTQAATLLWGLIRNHPFIQGNKRTATIIAFHFVERQGYRINAPYEAVLRLVYGVVNDTIDVTEAAEWFCKYSFPF